jgi:hypothetical protein
MRLFYLIVLFIISEPAFTQSTRSARTSGKAKSSTHSKRHPAPAQNAKSSTNVKPRQTITEKYLKGPQTPGSRSSDTTPFVGGIHASPTAGEKFDSARLDPDLNGNPREVSVKPIAAPNDTVFNENSGSPTGVLSNSGAEDRSGNAQFGQTNWGNSRGTVGESQWTVPPPVTASFAKEFPTVNSVNWSRNEDTSVYSVRYRTGESWVTSNYSSAGKKLDVRMEVPLFNVPTGVRNYISKLPNNLQVTTITRWQVVNRPDVYEINTRVGKVFHVNTDGQEVGR